MSRNAGYDSFRYACECGTPGCDRRRTMTKRAYVRLAELGPVLHPSCPVRLAMLRTNRVLLDGTS